MLNLVEECLISRNFVQSFILLFLFFIIIIITIPLFFSIPSIICLLYISIVRISYI